MSHIVWHKTSLIYHGHKVEYLCAVLESSADEIGIDEPVQEVKPGRHKRGRASYSGTRIYKRKRDMDRAMEADEIANIEEAIAIRLVEYNKAKSLRKMIYSHEMDRTLWRIWAAHQDKLLSVTASAKYDDLLDKIDLPKLTENK